MDHCNQRLSFQIMLTNVSQRGSSKSATPVQAPAPAPVHSQAQQAPYQHQHGSKPPPPIPRKDSGASRSSPQMQSSNDYGHGSSPPLRQDHMNPPPVNFGRRHSPSHSKPPPVSRPPPSPAPPNGADPALWPLFKAVDKNGIPVRNPFPYLVNRCFRKRTA
jgi:hypothetical protein